MNKLWDFKVLKIGISKIDLRTPVLLKVYIAVCVFFEGFSFNKILILFYVVVIERISIKTLLVIITSFL